MSRQSESTVGGGDARLPDRGRSAEEIRQLMATARGSDADWRDGRLAAYVYYAGEEVLQVAKEAYASFFSENGLALRAFPSLQRFEADVVSMAAKLLQGERAVGNITSGGTESILLAVKTARDRARAERGVVADPEILMPRTAHPAYNKAAHYFGLRPVRTPVDRSSRADLGALEAAVTDRTVLMVGSAPDYSFGVVDPIPEMARIAGERGISFHVDACLGGFVLPFLEKLGYPVRGFDFRVPGVTSISADIHKYGYAAKGASVILYRDPEIHRYQPFQFDEWPTGLYSSPTVAGTRPGGAIAAAWAVMQYLGVEGYLQLARRAMATARALIDGINGTTGLAVWGEPDMTVFSYGSRTMDIHAVADGMSERGWYVSRQASPPGIHLTVTPAHEPVVAAYLEDLAEVVRRVAALGLTGGGAEVSYS